MSATAWILDALGDRKLMDAKTASHRHRLLRALDLREVEGGQENLRFAAGALELALHGLLREQVPNADDVRKTASDAFQLLRAIAPPKPPLERQEWLLRLACQAVLGDRSADVRRLLSGESWESATSYDDWGSKVRSSIYSAWLRIIRKRGWDDLQAVQIDVVDLRARQGEFERQYLERQEQGATHSAAWELVTLYHLAKAADLLVEYTTQGTAEGTYDIKQKLEAQFDRALAASEQTNVIELASMTLLLVHTASALVGNSIWGLSRGVGRRVQQFVASMVSPDRKEPLFELLPPQRRTLREKGLISSGRRSVVVSLPTSSGKTLIAQFRILQALNQFEDVRGWVAYLAPTRALVNQITTRLRRDFAPLGISVERVSPALEVDGLEETLLLDQEDASRFRVLVTTPEKLDLMLRVGWERKIGRPLTLVIVDEAHNLNQPERGIKLELLLATVNRECRDAQFLLLTPFITNGEAIARWLDPESYDTYQDFDMSVNWQPNDRAIVLSSPKQDGTRKDFHLEFTTLHTNKDTITLPEVILLPQNRPLGLTWSNVHTKSGDLAAATAQVLRQRGSVAVLGMHPGHCWSIADKLVTPMSRDAFPAEDVLDVCAFLDHSFGSSFKLQELIQHRVAVHHAGLSDEARMIVEWLFEQGHVDVLVATTTIAQGVNFPVSGVVLASHYHLQRGEMPPADFWNIAGRAGRVDQGDLGIVALVCKDDTRAEAIKTFVNRSVGALNSTLIDMVQKAASISGGELPLHSLSHLPGWSSFVQYLAHTYRQIDDHDQFASKVEEILRGTLGFSTLRLDHPHLAAKLIEGVRSYAERLIGKPLSLVDSTGFSWETVNNTLRRLGEQRINESSWNSDLLFRGPSEPLRKMMGILLEVPELRENLIAATGGDRPDGNKLARMISDWVQGAGLEQMATTYFAPEGVALNSEQLTESMTKCCQNLFGRLTQTASWGLAALQAMTLSEPTMAKLSQAEQQTLRNLPARVYYGVNTDEAIALRLLGVPREASQPLANQLGSTSFSRPLSGIRKDLRDQGPTPWITALGPIGKAYHRAWTILEGNG